jgi:hypothetical protein
MKKIIKSALLLLCSICILSACADDRDSNPTLQNPTEGSLVLNIPGMSENAIFDLANSNSVNLTLNSLPNYGFPAYTTYTVSASLDSNMGKSVDILSASSSKLVIDAASLASELTTLALAEGYDTDEFPLTIPVYFQVRAAATKYAGSAIEGTETTSNIVSLKNVLLQFALPPVNPPANLYVVGNFNGWSWDSSLTMAPTYDATNKFWHIVWIDESGLKFNAEKAWDGGEVGFGGLRTISGSRAGDIVDSGGNIASSKPGWYLMIITAEVAGRDIVYDAQFEDPNVYLMGPVTPNGDWKELEDGTMLEIPTTLDGQFVSPAFAKSVPGGDGDGVRAYVKIEGFDWWKTEFMVFGTEIKYRGAGGDQERVAGNAGQKLYLNFGNDTGEIK